MLSWKTNGSNADLSDLRCKCAKDCFGEQFNKRSISVKNSRHRMLRYLSLNMLDWQPST